MGEETMDSFDSQMVPLDRTPYPEGKPWFVKINHNEEAWFIILGANLKKRLYCGYWRDSPEYACIVQSLFGEIITRSRIEQSRGTVKVGDFDIEYERSQNGRMCTAWEKAVEASNNTNDVIADAVGPTVPYSSE